MKELSKRLLYDIIPKGLTQWFAVICGIITVLGFPVALIKAILKANPEAYALTMTIVFCGFFTILVLVLIIEEFRWHRKARYAEAQSRVHLAYHNLRDAWYALRDNASDTIIGDFIRDGITEFACAFSIITGVSCRACIKDIICVDPITEQPERRYAVRTLLRCAVAESDAEPNPNDDQDYLSNNSDFLYLYKNFNEKRFLLKDVTKAKGYQNTHCNPPGDTQSLPYRSVCVWPIRKKLTTVGTEGQPPDEMQDIVSFLCVDSMARNAFRDRFDVDFGAAFADTLYQVLKGLRDRKEQKLNTTKHID